jgi:hypothetical protein
VILFGNTVADGLSWEANGFSGARVSAIISRVYPVYPQSDDVVFSFQTNFLELCPRARLIMESPIVDAPDRSHTAVVTANEEDFDIQEYFVEIPSKTLLTTVWSNGSKHLLVVAVLHETSWVCASKDDPPVTLRGKLVYHGHLYHQVRLVVSC